MELLSPAGDFESLKTAVQCGADAVYLGGKSFSARRNANNFTDEELKEAVDYCHLYQVKVYVTLNIVIKQHEFEDAIRFATYLTEIGVDGIIVQDLGLLCAIRELSPDVRINASTQMTICSSDGVNLLKDLGVSRVVLARELSKAEIERIKSQTDVELEMFVHGAMCMCWSGQCLLSSIIGGRSGNRGLCAQPCRLSYTLLKDGKAVTDAMPLLCMKDLCLAEDMKTLPDIADSAKIEGRMKSPEYTGVVTKVYKKALSGEINKQEIQNMLSFFSRGGSGKGYFEGRAFEKAMDYDVTGKVTASKEQLTEIRQSHLEKKRIIDFILWAEEGKPLTLQATSGDISVKATGDVCETAKNPSIDTERLKVQIAKLGDTPFEAGNVDVHTEGQPFVAISALNGLRRQACGKLQEEICGSYRRTPDAIPERPKVAEKSVIKPELCVQVRTKEQLKAAETMGISAVYMSYDLFCEMGREKDVCVLPSLTKEGEKRTVERAERVMIQNLGQIPGAKGKILCGGERLNVTNSETARRLNELGLMRVTLSPELNMRELKQIIDETDVPTEIIAYGRLPVMLMENCVIKSAYRCTKGEGVFELRDRMGERFPLICEGCRNVMLNNVPLYMADKVEDLLKLNAGAIRLMFTTETYDETCRVIAAYQSGLAGDEPQKAYEKITRGHFYRGVE